MNIRNNDDELEFKHLSLQEALLADLLSQNLLPEFWGPTPESAFERLSNPTWRNTFHIAGASLGQIEACKVALQQRRGKLEEDVAGIWHALRDCDLMQYLAHVSEIDFSYSDLRGMS